MTTTTILIGIGIALGAGAVTAVYYMTPQDRRALAIELEAGVVLARTYWRRLWTHPTPRPPSNYRLYTGMVLCARCFRSSRHHPGDIVEHVGYVCEMCGAPPADL